MSFILDALKKSEHERQRQLGPSLAQVQAGRRAADRPWWVMGLVALLAVNLVVLLLVLLRDPAAQPTRSATAPVATAPAGGTQVPLPASASSLPRGDEPTLGARNPAVRPLALEAQPDESQWPPEGGPTWAAAATVPEGPPLVRPVEAPAVVPLEQTAGLAPQNTTLPEVLPSFHELVAGGVGLPQLRIDIHVYSANPAERFVFVNLQRYSEGQTLKEGPILEQITRDGAVLDYRGRRFVLPRE